MTSSTISILSVSHYRFGLTFKVQGETGKYTVDWNIYKGWLCDCPDHLFRKHACKHIQACRDYVERQGLLLHMKLWAADPKADMVLFEEVAV